FVEQLVRFVSAARGGRCDVSAREAADTVGLVEWAYGRRNARPRVEVSEPVQYVVTGATGFIGSRLVERLVQNPENVITAPVRRYRNCASIARHASVALQHGDLFDEEALRRMLAGKRYLVHLAYANENAESYRVNVEGTQNLVRAAAACGIKSMV